jgi:hypothetical protein
MNKKAGLLPTVVAGAGALAGGCAGTLDYVSHDFRQYDASRKGVHDFHLMHADQSRKSVIYVDKEGERKVVACRIPPGIRIMRCLFDNDMDGKPDEARLYRSDVTLDLQDLLRARYTPQAVRREDERMFQQTVSYVMGERQDTINSAVAAEKRKKKMNRRYGPKFL